MGVVALQTSLSQNACSTRAAKLPEGLSGAVDPADGTVKGGQGEQRARVIGTVRWKQR